MSGFAVPKPLVSGVKAAVLKNLVREKAEGNSIDTRVFRCFDFSIIGQEKIRV